jgi:hypothetical protein
MAPASKWLFIPWFPKLSWFGLPPLRGIITPCSDLGLGWGLKQTCSSCREFSSGVSHFTCTHWGRVESWLLVVGSQIVNLTPNLSFCHNLCCKCPNDSCKLIFDIYVSIAFQWYKEHHNARCFDPYNRIIKFWESRRTPKSPFRECESHPHTFSKWGCERRCAYLWIGKSSGNVWKNYQWSTPPFGANIEGLHNWLTIIAINYKRFRIILKMWQTKTLSMKCMFNDKLNSLFLDELCNLFVNFNLFNLWVIFVNMWFKCILKLRIIQYSPNF